MFLLFSFTSLKQEANVSWCESSRTTRSWFSTKERRSMTPLLVWADTCLPALEDCSSKGHYGRRLEARGFKFLWNVGIDVFCSAFTSQEEEGSMSCKAFSRTAGVVFVVWIKSPMTTASQRNLRPGRQSRMKAKLNENLERTSTQTQNTLCRKMKFDSLIPTSGTVRRISYHSRCIHIRVLLYYAGNLLIEWDLHSALPKCECWCMNVNSWSWKFLNWNYVYSIHTAKAVIFKNMGENLHIWLKLIYEFASWS